ncbi:MAG: S8 family serine peptidase [Cryobacterium sp.]|nr:S8 family serine peptidase [Oligoflexia bacterium]
MDQATRFFLSRATLQLAALGLLASCANSSQKNFLPVVAKIGSEVRAISSEEAKSICGPHYCEDNQLYSSNFGRKQPTDPAPLPVPPSSPRPPSPPGPTSPPANIPSQPAQVTDYPFSLLHIADAWKFSKGSPSLVVAVIDSGVDYFHPDLKNNIAVNTVPLAGFPGDKYGWDFVNNRPNAYDDNGHGTHCAGVIAAEDNGIGVVGVAPRVKILPVKFLGSDGVGDTADAVKAVDYAVARGARVISNSWAGRIFSPLLNDAIQRAVNKGVIFVAAAGNESVDNDTKMSYPAAYANVIAVGSSDRLDARSFFSNYGKKSVLLFAPGTYIFSTFMKGQYRVESGTSMAAPQVAGTIALGLSVNRDLTLDEVADDLCGSAVERLLDSSKCGRVDAGEFVKRVSVR